MTGIIAAMIFSGSSSFTVTNPGPVRSSTGGSPGAAFIPQFTFETDGTATFKNTAGSNVAAANWGVPTTVGIGSQYWVKFTNGSGTGVYSGATVGVWINISSTVLLGINSATSGNVQQRSGSYQIATDSAGSNVVGSGTYSLTSDRS